MNGDNSTKEHSKEDYGGGAGAHKEIVTEHDKNITSLKQSLLEQKVPLRKRNKGVKVEKQCMRYNQTKYYQNIHRLGVLCLLTLRA